MSRRDGNHGMGRRNSCGRSGDRACWRQAWRFCCGCQKGIPTKVIHGTVTYDGQKVPEGTVRFMPIDGTLGPASTSTIVNGEYRVEGRGGVPLGKHRIEVDARKKTGRKIMGTDGRDTREVDETVRLGPDACSDQRSPLRCEVTAKSDGRIDIEIPKTSN